MTQQFYSKGKLLLTGEYVILDGAKGLALPTKKGQSLEVAINDNGFIEWESYDCHNSIWFSTKISTSYFFNVETPKSDYSKIETTLFEILTQAQKLNSNFFDRTKGYKITTHLEFERLWGLGTSSTLINNIAQWAKVNPFELLNNSFGGSGYDIAAANANSTIIYQRGINRNFPKVTSIHFKPKFKNKLFFVYLEKKKDSKNAISNYKALPKSNLKETIKTIDEITKKVSECEDFTIFEHLLTLHEELLSNLLQVPTIKESLFFDFKGAIKSLGGWGGDFILATGKWHDMDYFHKKGYTTIIPYTDMVLE